MAFSFFFSFFSSFFSVIISPVSGETRYYSYFISFLCDIILAAMPVSIHVAI